MSENEQEREQGNEDLDQHDVEARPSPGALLRQAREDKGLTVEDISSMLKLSVRQVDALESDSYDRLQGATFVRGFIRNYARILKLDAASVLLMLDDQSLLPRVEELHPTPNVAVKMPVDMGRHGHRGWGIAIFGAILLFVVACILYFMPVDLTRLFSKSAVQASARNAQFVTGNIATGANQETQAVPLPLAPPVQQTLK